MLTWSNGTIWSKLDRVLLNSNWLAQGPNCLVNFLAQNTQSDHSPTIISFLPDVSPKNRPFKFMNLWMKHPKFNLIIREGWSTPILGTYQYRLCMKLKSLKAPLRSLNKEEYSHLSSRVKAAQDDFCLAQNLLQNDPTSLTLRVQVKQARAKANLLLEAERSYFQHKFRTNHLVFADKGSKYFHSMLWKKKAKNTIDALTKSNGDLTTSQEEVSQLLIDYYTDLLGSENLVSNTNSSIFCKGPILSEEDSSFLAEPIDIRMIKESLFSIGMKNPPNLMDTRLLFSKPIARL